MSDSGMTFNDGAQAMTRHCIAAVKLVERGQWSMTRLKQWLNACLENDPKFLQEVKHELNQKTSSLVVSGESPE